MYYKILCNVSSTLLGIKPKYVLIFHIINGVKNNKVEIEEIILFLINANRELK